MNLRPLPADGVIREAGRYDIPMDIYHTQCCEGPSVSSSGLRKIYHESPADFWAYSDLNENRVEPEDNDAFTFGRAAHALLLGDREFAETFIVLPQDAPPAPLASQVTARLQGRVSEAAQVRFDFWDEFQGAAEGKEILKYDDMAAIVQMAEAIRADPMVPILMQGEAEQSLIWQDDHTGIWLKSRLDILSANGDLADLKTTSQKHEELLLREIRLHGYDMQMGLATMALEQVMGVPFTPETYAGRAAILIFIHKKAPFHILPVELDFDALYWGRIKCRAAINTMAEAMQSGYWANPLNGKIAVYKADYEATKLADLQRAGLLPNYV